MSDEDYEITATDTVISGDENIAHDQDAEDEYTLDIDLGGLPENIKWLYQIIESTSMGVGGDGTPGDERVSPDSTPLYGELKPKALVQIISFLIDKTKMNDESLFLDVGSGRGIPSIVVSQMSMVKLSYGIEKDPIRYQLSMNSLHGVCKDVIENRNEMRACFFQKLDYTSLQTFDPFTHIYCYSTG